MSRQLPPLPAAHRDTSLPHAIAITTLASSRSRQRRPFHPPLPKPFSLLPRCATPLRVSPPPFTELNPGERRSLAVAPRHADRSVLRICLQWRCATPIIPRVLHLRTASCNSADDGEDETLGRVSSLI